MYDKIQYKLTKMVKKKIKNKKQRHYFANKKKKKENHALYLNVRLATGEEKLLRFYLEPNHKHAINKEHVFSIDF